MPKLGPESWDENCKLESITKELGPNTESLEWIGRKVTMEAPRSRP